MALATLHNPTVAHQIQLFEQELSQGISEGLGCDLLGLVALCHRLGIIVTGEDCGKEPSALALRAEEKADENADANRHRGLSRQPVSPLLSSVTKGAF